MAALSRDAVVVDLGSGVIKCGFAGQNKPQCVYGAVIGRPKYPRAMPGGELIGDMYVLPTRIQQTRNAREAVYMNGNACGRHAALLLLLVAFAFVT